MRKRMGIIALALILGMCPTLSVSAATSAEVKQQKKETESKLNSVQSDIDDIQSNLSELEDEIEEIDLQLVDMLTTVSILEDDIATKDIMIDDATTEYEAAKVKEETQYEAMKKRIKFMYEKGEQSYLELFLQSASITEVINKVDYVEKLYEYDRELLEEYQKTKEEVFRLKTNLEEEKSELEEVQADYVEQSNELQALIDEKRASVEDFDSQLSKAKEKASQYQAELKAQNTMIKQLEAAEAAKRAEEARKAAEEAARKKAAEEAARKAEAEKSKSVASKDSDSDSHSSNDDDDDEEEEHHEEEHEEHHSSDSGDSSLGREIADYASQFVGNPYVAGGTSLTEGCDCSGFTSAVYSHFGISLPRSSYSQSTAGREVSYSEVQPGDVLYYGGHVGIYVGNGTIVHASTTATGIKFSNALYRSVITVRRFV